VLVYRIAKEAMVNVRKHARATRVLIDVRRVEDGVEVIVSDDGVGLPPEEPTSRPGHRGVHDMRDRAAIAGGSVTLRDGDQGGAVVRLWIPLSDNRD
jgi:signal transduction histidine kinase